MNTVNIKYFAVSRSTLFDKACLDPVLTINLPIYFVLKILSAYYVCRIFSKALQNIFTIEANTIDPYQTADPRRYCLHSHQ